MNCVLFIDYENIAISLNQARQMPVSPMQLARVMREAAECHGRIKTARAFADWDRFTGAARAFAQHGIEPRFVLHGKNSADMELSLQVQEALAEGDASVDTYILATGDRDFLAIVGRMRHQNKRVVIWGVEGRTSEQLRLAADEFVAIEEMLGASASGASGVLPSAPYAGPVSTVDSRQQRLRTAPQAPGRPAVAIVDPDEVEPRAASPGEIPAQGTAGERGVWTIPALATLILRFDLLLYERGWHWVAFKTLVEEIADDATFGQTSAERAWWVNLAIAEGMVVTERRPHARNPDAEITVCLINHDHPLVRTGLTVLPKTIDSLREQLHNKPWVAYGLLDRTLASDPSLPLEAQDRRFWINTLIHMGVITTEKKDNPNFPDRPVTGCHLNGSHPIARRFRSGPQNPEEWLDYHLILLVDHFLVSREMPWMSMGQLRRALEERYGSEKMRRAVDRAVASGELVVEHYPNRLNPERPTAGCRLNSEHPLIQKIRRNVDGLIRLIATQLQYRPWASMATLERAMGFHRQYGELDEERQAWLALLMEPGILLVDKRPDPSDPEFPTIACRLNFADRRVQAALTEDAPPQAQIA